MSLKGFHLVFIVFSIMLTIGFGMWALNNYGNPTTPGLRATAGISFLISIALTVYFFYFIRKLNVKI